MLERILKLYVMAMAGDVRSPVPHLFGPPGCGKSTVVEQAAAMLGVNLHVINVSRISPLELEGVQMPESIDGEKLALRLLHATFWTQLKENDIVLFDEFLRGFPEVYNGLLDILTARSVGGFKLPKVFIIAASNSTVAYDKALEDRLLHLPVPDPRKSKLVKRQIATLITDQLGLLPTMADSYEMASLLDTEVLPMYDVLDKMSAGNSGQQQGTKGTSIRKLIGQAQLREVQSSALQELLDMNNKQAIDKAKHQFVLLTSARGVDARFEQAAAKLPVDKLTEVQRHNLAMNLQLIGLEAARREKEGNTADDDDDIFNVEEPPF